MIGHHLGDGDYGKRKLPRAHILCFFSRLRFEPSTYLHIKQRVPLNDYRQYIQNVFPASIEQFKKLNVLLKILNRFILYIHICTNVRFRSSDRNSSLKLFFYSLFICLYNFHQSEICELQFSCFCFDILFTC